jgi:hypothetical protein
MACVIVGFVSLGLYRRVEQCERPWTFSRIVDFGLFIASRLFTLSKPGLPARRVLFAPLWTELN